MKFLIILLSLLITSSSFAVELDPSFSWYGDNQKKINVFLKTKNKGVAAFDWDNTVVKNDIGNAFFYWMLTHNLIKMPQSWESVSIHLTSDTIIQLNKLCPITKKEKKIDTKNNLACADLLLNINDSKKYFNPESFNPDHLEPSYAFVAQMLSGYTKNEIKKIAKEMKEFQLTNPIGTKIKIGNQEVDGWIRYYDQMKDLIAKLKASGFDVWIISASPQWLVEVFAQDLNLGDNKIIGIRPILNGKKEITPYFEPCGTYKTKNQNIITYRQGKRCFLNKIIFKIKKQDLMMNQPVNLVFAAGDSNTDFFFVKDSSQLRLVINRNGEELMCHAYNNHDGHWLINPMFINPKPKKKENYECKKFGLPDVPDLVF